jgi:hypothetical protein
MDIVWARLCERKGFLGDELREDIGGGQRHDGTVCMTGRAGGEERGRRVGDRPKAEKRKTGLYQKIFRFLSSRSLLHVGDLGKVR